MAQKLTKVAEVTDLETTDTIVVIDESVQNPDGSSGAVRRIKKTNMDKAGYITVDGVKYPITSIAKTTKVNITGVEIAYGEGQTLFIPDGYGMAGVEEFLQTQIDEKVSDIKLNGVSQDKDASGVVDITAVTPSQMTEAISTKADVIVKTASGSIASFSDGGDDMPMKSLKVNIVPKQSGSGDPSPSNVRPISGWDSVNAFRSARNIFSGLPNELVPLYIPTSAEVTASASNGVVLHYYDENKVEIDYWTLSERSGDRYYRTFTISPSKACHYVSFVGNGTDLQIELGGTLTSYEEPTTITANLGQTVYGGVLDVVSGKGDSDRAVVDGGDLYWIYWTMNTYYAEVAGKTAKTIDDIQCEIYPTKSVFNADSPNGIMCSVSAGVKNIIYITDSTVADATALKAKLTGHKICYRLATASEFATIPTEVKTKLGSNNIWSESGTVDVEYRADTTLAYNELLNLIANM